MPPQCYYKGAAQVKVVVCVVQSINTVCPRNWLLLTHHYTHLFPCTGLASLVDICLRVIVSREELMNVAEGSYGSGYKAKLIRAHSRHANCPLITDITHL